MLRKIVDNKFAKLVGEQILKLDENGQKCRNSLVERFSRRSTNFGENFIRGIVATEENE